MTMVNFYTPVNLVTGHPTFQQLALWIGRATITQEIDYDDQDQPFSVDKAEIADLFFMPDAGADIRTARRVELPDNSRAGYTFRYSLEQAAITAYHNPKLQPGEMPDDELQYTPEPGDTVIFPTVTGEDLNEFGIYGVEVSEIISLPGNRDGGHKLIPPSQKQKQKNASRKKRSSFARRR